MAPGKLSIWSINVSTVLLSWKCTDEYKIGYVIVCYSNNTFIFHRNITTLNDCHYLEQDFKSNVTYSCEVASYNAYSKFGVGPFSDPVLVTLHYDGMLLDCSMWFQIVAIFIPDSIPWYPKPNVTVLAITMNSVTMTIDQGSHDVPDNHVIVENIGYNVTCWSSSTLNNVVVWGSVVNVTVDKLLPNQQYSCNIISINKLGTGRVGTVDITTSPSG